jgi:hypothetical protein
MRCGHGTAGDHGGSYASQIIGAIAVSACSSLPITGAAARLGRVLVTPDRVPVDLLAALSEVADPRARRGVRHSFAAILAPHLTRCRTPVGHPM